MNSTIFVHPPNVITVGPIGDVEPGIVVPSKPKSVAAIIRPVPRDSGLEGSLRIDPADSKLATAHVRTHQLDDYVKWLRDKIRADRKRPPVQMNASEPANQSPDNQSVTYDETSEIDRLANDTQSAEKAKPQPELHQESTVEFAQATHSVEATIGATNVESDAFFSTIATDNQLDKELMGQSISTESTSQPVSEPKAKKRGHAYSTKIFDRIDSPHRPEITMPTAHVPFTEETQAQPSGDEGATDANSQPSLEPLSKEDAEIFISTVSKAIATVLTEKSEPEFEEQIRTHFESELHASVIQTIVSRSSVVPAEDNDLATPQPKQPSSPKMKLETQIAAELLRDSPKEIPSDIAAWDVEDFRWPSVTDRMIVSGGEAIDQLSRSISEMTSPDYQRVAITGLGRGEGTSSIAISLARWSAASGKRVLLVDADIASPTLGSDIGLAPNLSWINAISQSLSPAEVIVRSQKTNLCVMPMSKMVSRVTWPRFIFNNLGELIDRVRNHFDLVILDMGPASQFLAELSQPEHLVDATLLVHDGIVSAEFDKTKSRLEALGVNKFIIAQNRARNSKANVA